MRHSEEKHTSEIHKLKTFAGLMDDGTAIQDNTASDS